MQNYIKFRKHHQNQPFVAQMRIFGDKCAKRAEKKHHPQVMAHVKSSSVAINLPAILARTFSITLPRRICDTLPRARGYCAEMKAAMASRTSGAMVSLISLYSAISPVAACCSRWLRPGIRMTVAWGTSLCMAARLSASTWISLSPLTARTGHFILARNSAGSRARRCRTRESVPLGRLLPTR